MSDQALVPKIYGDKGRMVMVFPPKWVCQGCGHPWASRLKALDVNVIVPDTDENICPLCGQPGSKQPEQQYEYRERRCGVTWPGPRNPGYVVVFGQRNEVSGFVYRQTDMLGEGEEDNMERFFDLIIEAMRKFHCTWLCCDRSEKYDTQLFAFGRHVAKRNFKIDIVDMSGIGGFEEARPIVDDMIRDDLLFIMKGSRLRQQSGRLTPVDLHTKDRVGPEERFWSVNAMHFVLVSWSVYPYRKEGKQQPPKIRR